MLGNTAHSIETVSGRWVDFLNPDPQSICIEDIAWALSQQCRYNGHSSVFYSVATHSIQVAEFLSMMDVHEGKLALCGLLHDASEAYLGDVATPLKKLMPEYKKIEKKFEEVILKKFKLYDYYLSNQHLIKHADLWQLKVESHFFLPSGGKGWACFNDASLPKVEVEYMPLILDKSETYTKFVEYFYECGGSNYD